MDTSGIEPEASSMPRKRSTPDLRALKIAASSWRLYVINLSV